MGPRGKKRICEIQFTYSSGESSTALTGYELALDLAAGRVSIGIDPGKVLVGILCAVLAAVWRWCYKGDELYEDPENEVFWRWKSLSTALLRQQRKRQAIQWLRWLKLQIHRKLSSSRWATEQHRFEERNGLGHRHLVEPLWWRK